MHFAVRSVCLSNEANCEDFLFPLLTVLKQFVQIPTDFSCAGHMLMVVLMLLNFITLKQVSVVCLDFCKAFDVVPHHVLISQLEREGYERWTIK